MVVVLIKDTFKSQGNLGHDILKAFIQQIIFQRPFLFSRVENYYRVLAGEEIWTEQFLWIFIRTLFRGPWKGELILLIADISNWLLPLRPILDFLDTMNASSKVRSKIICTNTSRDLSGLPGSTRVIDMVKQGDWDYH